MIDFTDEKRPAFFRRMSPEAFFEGEALEIWKGLREPPVFAELDARLDAELDQILAAQFMPPAVKDVLDPPD